MSAPASIHANALLVGETGLLLRGPSGAGKSALTLALMERTRDRGEFAALIGDDRVVLAAAGGRVVARGRPEIAGLIEVRNLGLVRVPYEPAAAIRGVVDLLAPEAAWPERHPEEKERCVEICGVRLPRLLARGGNDATTQKILVFLRGLTSI